jgi:putative chitinase
MKLQIHRKYRSQFIKYGVNTQDRISMFLAQAEHENGEDFLPKQENLNYSAKGLLKTFGKYFKTMAMAVKYARKPRLIANIVYGGRMGNEKNGISDDDGWDFSGKGFFQLTGKDNYARFSKDTGIDALNNPQILLNEAEAVISALWFWQENRLNRFADKRDLVGCTRVLNGGLNGIAHRSLLYKKWSKINLI